MSFFDEFKPDTEEYTFPSGNKIQIRGMTLKERAAFLQASQDDSIAAERAQALLVIAGCDLDEGDIDKVMNLPADQLDEISSVVMKLSKLGVKKKADAGTEV